MKKIASYWVKQLDLAPHPEGGYYKEIYRAEEFIKADSLPERFTGDRNHSTAIYYLLEEGDYSCFHRIKSDEIWHHYAGGVIHIYILEDHTIKLLKLGMDIEGGEQPVCVVPKNTWFAAEPSPETEYALAGCTVAPGFDFQDFEMANQEQLKSYLNLDAMLIQRFIK
ncbi:MULTISPECIES: cupin domain-containing protein [unclassified Lentimicrobium]|uniref:cupin domain-containing protein n=1 Tax=unclassified Lentimicrobium TaxID=2677434 RepID=UPI00155566FE|nr:MULTISPECIES: cupin domain-containing protein [unclassified Lentimicrobium]NPD44332.1 cupin domain-containing protein [Lentimicrobium sp. S6]NPD86900.1 cupin domain-containing protein [Lentimicrobium sp. L6]